MRRVVFLIAALAVPVAGLAADGPAEAVSDRIARAVDIPVEEWAAMASGRTLTYRIDGELWAMEHYVPGTDRVVLQFQDGTCINGTWDFAAPLYCFHWEVEGTSCFRHVRSGDEILILETVDGVDTGAVQVMTGVSDTPLACGPAVMS